MKTNTIAMTIADYCDAFSRNDVRIDRTYQRSPSVWPVAPRSYLIETILKGFPIPKLALHQVTDLKSKKTFKYVVDGQQRSAAILDFFGNRLRLSRSLELEEAAGKTYEQLPPPLQGNFLSYSLNFDQFEFASDEDVREYFRRINSFTAPLNAEEQRHSRYQGAMKWFVHALTQKHGESLVNLGVLPKQSVVRMADAKFIAELVHALLYGVATTSKTKLDKMYRDYDRGDEVPAQKQLDEAIDGAVGTALGWTTIAGTALMRTNVFYSLILAVIAVHHWETLVHLLPSHSPKQIEQAAEENLLKLATALDDPDSYPEYKEFTDAAGEKTNVKAQRETRIRWLVRALTEKAT